MRHARALAGRQRPGMLMLGLLALCALLGGPSVVAAHVHPTHQTAQDDARARPSIATADDDCALCDAVAAFEPFLPSEAIAVPPAFAILAVSATPARAYPMPPSRGHGWRSRAPPEPSPT